MFELFISILKLKEVNTVIPDLTDPSDSVSTTNQKPPPRRNKQQKTVVIL